MESTGPPGRAQRAPQRVAEPAGPGERRPRTVGHADRPVAAAALSTTKNDNGL